MLDVVDGRGIRQGEPGYSNVAITPGDMLLSIDGRDAQKVSQVELHEMLRGKHRKQSTLLYQAAILRCMLILAINRGSHVSCESHASSA